MARAATLMDAATLSLESHSEASDGQTSGDRALAQKLLKYHECLISAMGILDNRQAFRDVIAGAINLLGYTEIEISREFNCHLTMVNRWLRGEAAPVAGMRRGIYETLQAETRRRLRGFEAVA